VLEKVVDVQLENHLEQYKLHEVNQSVYRKSYSTKTALLRVHYDISKSLDQNEAVILVMLDLSAAFDTIDTAQSLRTTFRHRSQTTRVGDILLVE